ncbi:glycosyltransferase family 2 protein [Candidatus Omnitrophota bacterium]
MPAVSVILVTHNSSNYIQECLDSVLAQGLKDVEVIVVDNASEDQTKSLIKNRYPEVTILENLENLGPCKARNKGIARANGNFILCLDDDTKLSRNFLANVLQTLENDDRIGAVQPKVLRPDGEIIYSTGIHLSFLRRFHDIGSGKRAGHRFNRQRDTFGASCAAALYRKEALEAVRQGREYFDEDFFYFFEDVDLSWRLQKRGWRIVYTPKAVCLHAGGRSRNKDEISQYLCLRNRYFVITKNETLTGLLRLVIVFLAYDLWRNIFMLVTNPKYFLKASYGVVKFLPRMVKKRHNGENRH